METPKRKLTFQEEDEDAEEIQKRNRRSTEG